jgi:hypothetical protein
VASRARPAARDLRRELAAVAPGAPLHRFLIAIFSFWAAARVLDLARESHALRPAHRLAHVVAFLDTRPLQRVAPTFDLRGFIRGLAWLATSLIAVTLANWQSIGPHGPSALLGLHGPSALRSDPTALRPCSDPTALRP